MARGVGLPRLGEPARHLARARGRLSRGAAGPRGNRWSAGWVGPVRLTCLVRRHDERRATSERGAGRRHAGAESERASDADRRPSSRRRVLPGGRIQAGGSSARCMEGLARHEERWKRAAVSCGLRRRAWRRRAGRRAEDAQIREEEASWALLSGRSWRASPNRHVHPGGLGARSRNAARCTRHGEYTVSSPAGVSRAVLLLSTARIPGPAQRRVVFSVCFFGPQPRPRRRRPTPTTTDDKASDGAARAAEGCSGTHLPCGRSSVGPRRSPGASPPSVSSGDTWARRRRRAAARRHPGPLGARGSTRAPKTKRRVTAPRAEGRGGTPKTRGRRCATAHRRRAG